MSIIVDKEKCTSCGLCTEICPGDLVYLDKENKAYIVSPRDCWDCFSCVKVCPVQAISIRLPFELANYGAELMPYVEKDRIRWELTDPQGNKEEFIVRTRK